MCIPGIAMCGSMTTADQNWMGEQRRADGLVLMRKAVDIAFIGLRKGVSLWKEVSNSYQMRCLWGKTYRSRGRKSWTRRMKIQIKLTNPNDLFSNHKINMSEPQMPPAIENEPEPTPE